MRKIDNKNKKIQLTFNADNHIYTAYDKEVPSATTIINKVLGSPYVLETPEMVAARQKGTLIHSVFNEFLTTGKSPDFDMQEFNNFLRISTKGGYTWDLSEQMIFNSVEGMEYAGTLDLYDSKKKEISDVKTGSAKSLKKWQIQLSLYAWALRDTYGIEVERASILWLHGDKAEYIAIHILDKKEITNFLKLYYCPEQAEEASLKCLDTYSTTVFLDTLKKIAVLEETIKDVKEQIKKEMEERGLLQIKLGDKTISYVAPTEKVSLDSKKLKQEEPEIYEKYKKVSKVSSAIRIK